MFRVPDWLRNFLLNLDFQILTWHLDIGSYILAPIEWLLSPINEIGEWAQKIGAWWEEFRQEVLDFVNLVPVWIGEVWNWITNFGTMIGQWIADWWDGVQDTVREWIKAAVDVLLDLIRSLTGDILAVALNLADFFSNILPTLARTFDVQEWIRSALLPFRDLFNFFEAFRGELVAFFSDPLQWIYDKLDEFFERFW